MIICHTFYFRESGLASQVFSAKDITLSQSVGLIRKTRGFWSPFGTQNYYQDEDREYGCDRERGNNRVRGRRVSRRLIKSGIKRAQRD